MILPIVAYGAGILRKVAVNIDQDYPGIQELIESMWETMYASNGVGLAAPQINKSIRLFVMDSEQMFANMEEGDETFVDAPGIKKVFINPKSGSIRITGTVDMVDAEGNLIKTLENPKFCGCGTSKEKPLCDGSHKGLTQN